MAVEFLIIQATNPETYTDDKAAAVNDETNPWAITQELVCCGGNSVTFICHLSRQVAVPPEMQAAMRKTKKPAKAKRKK